MAPTTPGGGKKSFPGSQGLSTPKTNKRKNPATPRSSSPNAGTKRTRLVGSDAPSNRAALGKGRAARPSKARAFLIKEDWLETEEYHNAVRERNARQSSLHRAGKLKPQFPKWGVYVVDIPPSSLHKGVLAGYWNLFNRSQIADLLSHVKGEIEDCYLAMDVSTDKYTHVILSYHLFASFENAKKDPIGFFNIIYPIGSFSSFF